MGAGALGHVPNLAFPSKTLHFQRFGSRRSVVHSTKGMVACTQPLAGQAGIKILNQGGNAADAAVAVAAALNVTEPASTGIGGDMFCLYFDAKTKKVTALNGSGRSGQGYTMKHRKTAGELPKFHVHNVTVPGCAAGWVDTVEKFGSGKLSLAQILAPAIELAEDGFPVSEISSSLWQFAEGRLRKASPNYAGLLKKDKDADEGCRAPRPSAVMKIPDLAHTFRLLAEHGKKGFYEGEVAEAIIKVTQDLGGVLTLDDLKHHGDLGSEEVEPISIKFSGQDLENPIEVWEHPPNGQGLIILLGLGMFEELEKTGKIKPFTEDQHNSPEYLHILIEVLRRAFSDGATYVSDPSHKSVPVKELISDKYLAERIADLSLDSTTELINHGIPIPKSDTVYFAVTDKEGNGISFINSNFGGFGTGIVPKGCGFALQNRGSSFNVIDGHPNCIAPRKRPLHTIIPAMITNPADGGSLNTVFGVMGGFMQPQGQLQVIFNMFVFGMTPQEALDAPRICIQPASVDGRSVAPVLVYVEEGIPNTTVEQLKKLGHEVEVLEGFDRAMFGRGQVIRQSVDDGQIVWSGGSDPRGDGGVFPA